MPNGDVLAATLVQLATAGAAAWGAWRCLRLQRYASDRRLTALAWFFGLFAVAVLLLAVWTWRFGEQGGPGPFQPGAQFQGNGTAPPPPRFDRDGPFRPAGDERVNVVLFSHHLLMLASLAVGVVAFGRRRPDAGGATVAAAALSFGFLSDFVPALLALQAGLTLYLAARALVNHVERRSPGALQVALGFTLMFAGHLLFYLAHRPGSPRTGLGDVLGLVGITLLVQALPPRSALPPPTSPPPAASPSPSVEGPR